MISDETVGELWAKIAISVTAWAERCMADPKFAAEHAISPVYSADTDEASLGGRTFHRVASTRRVSQWAGWLRGAARARIPDAHWKYEIIETMGGGAYLVLHSYVGPSQSQSFAEEPATLPPPTDPASPANPSGS